MWLTVSSILTQQDVDGVSMEIIVSADGHEYAHTVEAIADRAAKALRGAGRDRYCRCCTVRAISSWHGGIANARNHGLAMLPPSTQWVQPIDGGDTIVSTFISQALQLATADPRINVVMPSLCVETGYKWKPPLVQDAVVPLHKQNALHCCVLVRMKLFSDTNGDLVMYDPAMGYGWEDWDMWVRLNAMHGLFTATVATECAYKYVPSGSAAPCSKLYHSECLAAFGVAQGAVYTPQEVLAFHEELLKPEAEAFRRLLLAKSPPSTPQSFPLPHMWRALDAEANGRVDEALRHYRLAFEMARIGARGFPTRGAVWQAARRMADIYKSRFDLVKVAEVCAEAAEVLFGAHGLRDTYASMPMPSYDLDTRLEAQWTATGCDIQALRPPALAPLAAQVECDSRGGRASPGGFCRCLPGFSGPSCSQREAPVPTDTSRVCLVSKEFGSIRKGGIGSAFAQLALFLAKKGFPVTVLLAEVRSPREARLREAVKEYAKVGVTVETLKQHPKSGQHKGRQHLVVAYWAYEWLRDNEGRCDIVHFHEWAGLGYFMTLAKHLGRAFQQTTLVVQLHGTWEWASHNQKMLNDPRTVAMTHTEVRTIEMADVVVSCSRYMVQHVRDYLRLDLDPRTTHVIPNILLGRSKSPVSFRDTQVAVDTTELVFFGKTDQFKGIDVFCDAVDMLVRRGQAPPKVTFLVRIKPVERDGMRGDRYIELRSEAWTQHGVEVTTLTGKNSAQCVEYLQQPGRVAIMPSVLENSPYVVLECISNRIPFIATAVGGTPELVHPEDREHALVEYGAKPLAERMGQVLHGGAHIARPGVSFEEYERKWVALNQLRPGSAPTFSHDRCFPGFPQERSAALVTVVIPTFNRPQLLRKVVVSVWEQTYAALEVLVVDDKSTQQNHLDALVELEYEFGVRARTLQSSFRSLRVVRNANNVYLGATRNHGVAEARGQLVLFVDDDDPLLPHTVEVMVASMCASGTDMLGARPWYHPYNTPETTDVSTDWLIAGGGLEGVVLNAFSGPLLLVRAASFRSLGQFTEIRAGCEDYELWTRAWLLGLRMEKAVEPLYWYREGHPGSMFGSMSQFDCAQRVLRWYKGAMPDKLSGLPELTRMLYELAPPSEYK